MSDEMSVQDAMDNAASKAVAKGHKLGKWIANGNTAFGWIRVAKCQKCGMSADVVRSAQQTLSIGGKAIESECRPFLKTNTA